MTDPRIVQLPQFKQGQKLAELLPGLNTLVDAVNHGIPSPTSIALNPAGTIANADPKAPKTSAEVISITVKTTLNNGGSLALPATSIPAKSTDGFQSTGVINVGDQVVTYSNKDATHFLGTIGGEGTIADGTTISQTTSIAGAAGIASVTETWEEVSGVDVPQRYFSANDNTVYVDVDRPLDIAFARPDGTIVRLVFADK